MCSKYVNHSRHNSHQYWLWGPIWPFDKHDNLHFDNEYELQKLWGKWLWFGFAKSSHTSCVFHILWEVVAGRKVSDLGQLTLVGGRCRCSKFSYGSCYWIAGRCPACPPNQHFFNTTTCVCYDGCPLTVDSENYNLCPTEVFRKTIYQIRQKLSLWSFHLLSNEPFTERITNSRLKPCFFTISGMRLYWGSSYSDLEDLLIKCKGEDRKLCLISYLIVS